jgi:predicted phage terminase large subunit-like protein
VVAPTYPMLRDATFRTFRALADALGQWLPGGWRRTDFVVECRAGDGRGTAEVLFRSADDPDRLRGPNLSGVWLDEASLTPPEVYEVLLGRLRESGAMGWMTATFTPKGKGHWTYEVFGRGTDNPDAALVHCRTADNPFLAQEFVDVTARQFGGLRALQELEGLFVDPAGAVFRRDWFRLVDAAPAGGVRVRFWDKAGTEGGGAHTAGVLMCRTPARRYCVLDVVRGQWSAGRREAVIRQTAELDRLRHGFVEIWVEQEPGSGGKESAQATIANLAGFVAHAETVTGGKGVRAEPFAAQAEAGNVDVLSAPWAAAYLDEVASFPLGRYADQVDASSGAFNKLAQAAGPFEAGLPDPAKGQGSRAKRAPGGVFGR